MNEQTQFKIDTSGAVVAPPFAPGSGHSFVWSDLSPFQQGAVEALLRDFSANVNFEGGSPTVAPYGFSDLSASALQRIMADCDAMLATLQWMNTVEAGRWCWRARQDNIAQKPAGLKPLTISLAEDGLIHLSEVGK